MFLQVRGKTSRGWGEFSHSLSATTGHTGWYTLQISVQLIFHIKAKT